MKQKKHVNLNTCEDVEFILKKEIDMHVFIKALMSMIDIEKIENVINKYIDLSIEAHKLEEEEEEEEEVEGKEEDDEDTGCYCEISLFLDRIEDIEKRLDVYNDNTKLENAKINFQIQKIKSHLKFGTNI